MAAKLTKTMVAKLKAAGVTDLNILVEKNLTELMDVPGIKIDDLRAVAAARETMIAAKEIMLLFNSDN